MNCINCQKLTDNPKFCSRSCSTIYNNKKFVKRKKKTRTGKCKNCGTIILKHERFCSFECKLDYKNKNPSAIVFTDEDWERITIKQYLEPYKNKRWQFHAKIRGLSKTVYERSDKPKKCISCGYDKFYEVCHIKSLASFPDNSFMSDLNSLDNLIALCPNCHWEFDHNLLSLNSD